MKCGHRLKDGKWLMLSLQTGNRKLVAAACLIAWRLVATAYLIAWRFIVVPPIGGTLIFKYQEAL